jgi:hypothetical protein
VNLYVFSFLNIVLSYPIERSQKFEQNHFHLETNIVLACQVNKTMMEVESRYPKASQIDAV